jgi:hypothetical protein
MTKIASQTDRNLLLWINFLNSRIKASARNAKLAPLSGGGWPKRFEKGLEAGHAPRAA